MSRVARLLLAAFACIAAASGASAQSPAPPRVLVYTVSAGFEHDVAKREKPDALSLVEQALVDLGARTGAFEAVPTRDPTAFEPASLARFQLVFFYTTGELPLSAEQRASLFAWVKQGGAFAGAHCATDTFAAVPEYGDMIGARFDGHPWHQKVRVRTEARNHVALRHLGDAFEIEDEIYQFQAPYDRARMRVLMSIDPASVDLSKPEVHRADHDFAMAWTKPWGKGRVFYTALGHRPEVWKDERFLKLLEGGFAWAMRVEERPKLSPKDATYATSASAGSGDPKRGFELFRRESGPMCARCHAVNGTRPTVEPEVGPDLSGVARRLAPEEIVDAILAPSASIEARYAAVSLELDDGTLAFGRIVKETEGKLTLADTNGLPRTIAASDIRARNPRNVSVMPDGLARTLSREEFADLCAYVMTLTVPAAPVPPK